MRAFLRLLWPRTLLARVTLLVVLGMALAQLLTYAAIRHERGQTLMNLMLSGVERDIASSVAILDRLPADERAAWFPRLERPNYSFALEGAGDIIGEHFVQFTGLGERVELVHRATNRDIFARGALHVARQLPGRAPGSYRVRDMVGAQPG